jgi:hypothetical protein
MFDQRGCLSPHHIFVEQRAREFAACLAAKLAELMPHFDLAAPRKPILEDAIALRRVRETVRWRRLGGEEVELWEDPNWQWTVAFDRTANFTPSPGWRTVFVSPFSDPSDLQRRLEPVRGRVEGFAIAGEEVATRAAGSALQSRRFNATPRLRAVRSAIESCGATYICGPGEMQSPPLDWPHGGGDFIRLFID